MTDVELLANVINSLDRINIPIGLIEQIGVPIANANHQLKALYKCVMDKTKAESNAEEEPIIKMEAVDELPDGAEVLSFDSPQE